MLVHLGAARAARCADILVVRTFVVTVATRGRNDRSDRKRCNQRVLLSNWFARADLADHVGQGVTGTNNIDGEGRQRIRPATPLGIVRPFGACPGALGCELWEPPFL
jgi:hypothetical protein